MALPVRILDALSRMQERRQWVEASTDGQWKMPLRQCERCVSPLTIWSAEEADEICEECLDERTSLGGM